MHLPIQFVGLPGGSLADYLGKRLMSVAWPASQSPGCTWYLELTWEDGTAWVISGVPTMTESGHEMGSLRLEHGLASRLPMGFERTTHAIGLEITSIQIGTSREQGTTSESGISLSDRGGREWVVATAPPPGAVVLMGLGEAGPVTEFELSGYAWRAA